MVVSIAPVVFMEVFVSVATITVIIAFWQYLAFIMVAEAEPEAIGLINELTHIVGLFSQAVAQVQTFA